MAYDAVLLSFLYCVIMLARCPDETKRSFGLFENAVCDVMIAEISLGDTNIRNHSIQLC